MNLEVSTSPRSTWIWAKDATEAALLLEELEAAGCSVRPATGRNAESRVLDIDIGWDAGEGLQHLQDAGYSFSWHHSQGVLDRTETVKGFPISDPQLGQ